MYPTISDLLRDLFGLNIPLPIQSFGFFVAIAFVLAYYTTSEELKRKEGQGLLSSWKEKLITGKAATPGDYAISAIIGALLGYKLLLMVLEYSAFARNPQAYILSTDGNWLGALLGAAISVWMRWRESEKEKLPEPVEKEITVHPYQLMGSVLIYAAAGGLLGAKVFHNLENLDDFMADPVGSLISFSGLTFYGGLIVGAAAVLYYTGKHGIKPLHMIDAAAPGLMLSYGVGRIGCHISGDGDWGINNLAPKPDWLSFLPDWAWAYRYPHNVLGQGIPIEGCQGSHCNMLEYPVFPTPFYEAIAGIALFFLLWSMRRRIQVPGLLFCVYLMINGLERFLVEKIRVNSVYHIGGAAITQAEIISSVLFIGGLAGFLYLRRQAKARAA